MMVPEDVRKYIRKYILKVILLCVISLIISAFICYFFSHIETHRGFRYILYSLIFAIPIVFIITTKIVMRLPWQGEIIKLVYENTVESERPYKPTLESLYNRNTLYGCIKLTNGNIKMKEIYSGRLKESSRLDDYKVGDKVIHIIGMDYCYVISKDFIQCGICGTKNKTDNTNDVCENCGYHFVN